MLARSPADCAIAFHDVTLGYERHPAVHHLAGRVEPGALLAVVGPNGAGKSTLLKGIAGLLRPLEGAITTGAVAREDIAYLPQLAAVDRSFPLNVGDFVAMGLWRKVGLFGRIGAHQHERLDAALAAVGLAGFARRPIGALSGGQMQRTLFARLLLQDAAIILLDEPFTAIDTKTAADLLALIQRWHGEARTVVAVLHDLETVKAHFPESLLLAREAIAWGPTAATVTPQNLLHARRLVEAFDPHAALCARGAA